MAIVPDSLSIDLDRSLLRSSHFRPQLPLLSPEGLSSHKSDPHLALQDRDSLFLTNRSRVVPTPKSLWTRRAEYVTVGSTDDGVWAVFGTHEEARSSLAFFGPTVSLSPALESDLEPFSVLWYLIHSSLTRNIKLACFQTGLSTTEESPMITNDLSSCDLIRNQTGLYPSFLRRSPEPRGGQTISGLGFNLSSNPPNPRNVFRLGDWMCPSTSCAAHNFGRNFICIGCGCPRPSTLHVPPASRFSFPTIHSAHLSSPRFAGILEPQMPTSVSHRIPHVLTPSGRAFSVGGRVQNVSSDPLSSCFLFWPDNEPLPEQGQIRPSSLVGVPHPPILNTGNKGPIEHQPGDWVCQKCNYLNWRRRKVCQTCYPYAEGNGDSIPAAVQADRIKRLREALTTTLTPSLPPLQTAPLDYLSQSPFVHIRQGNGCFSNSCGCPTPCSALPSGDQTCVEIGSRCFKDTIYQTSTPSVSSSYGEPVPFPVENASGRFLPSCLQDIVQSPSLSPSSTTSADLSVDEHIASPISVYSTGSTKLGTNGDPFLHAHRTPSSVSLGNIWQLDGEESKAFSSSLSSHHEISRV
ncbi:hypothetical protein F5148DRAFT_1273909 [Russula earlei]|uniref:Uncharacterized protein n=1 Tax=Russula earlei TaxID=71964 RepID=A0ACC0UKH7_9AGAM|nr:hypothetical protein F5148DRAFT_1273909 [Russula earlei]